MYVYGKNVIKALIDNNKKIKKVYLSDNFNDSSLLDSINNLNVEIKTLPKQELDKIEKGNHQGIIALTDDYKYVSENEMLSNMSENPFVVILDHLEDPHNFGAIIRTCEAAGVEYIIIPKDRSVGVTSTVVKTSVGAIYNVNIVMVTNLNNTIKKLKEKGLWIVGTDMVNSILYDEIDYKVPIGIIIGNEGSGMKSLVGKNCDFIARIPMIGKVNSLNASVAAGIMIYEVLRQRK